MVYAKYSVLGRSDKRNQYRVKVPRAETLFLAMESPSETESRMFGWYKGFVLNVLDQCGETAFIIRKEPSYMHLIGSLQAGLIRVHVKYVKRTDVTDKLLSYFISYL